MSKRRRSQIIILCVIFSLIICLVPFAADAHPLAVSKLSLSSFNEFFPSLAVAPSVSASPSPQTYSYWDATFILLREGMEALLVIVALLAFLDKSGNSQYKRWIWIGAGAGLILAIITGIVVQLLVSNVAAIFTNREIIEGVVGLFAAAMLFYVSYWLHSKSSLGAWQGYIKGKMDSAIAKNSVYSLAILSFLAVFREGAETVLFYLGIAPAIGTQSLLIGLGIGTVMLIAIAFLMLGLGLRLPIKPFFIFASLLIYYLGFKFIGSSIHALQVAGIIPTDLIDFIPKFKPLGLYPSWETIIPQAIVLVVAIAVVVKTSLGGSEPESRS
ncbi:FTR1 family iron permease [Merismopedia glauca]|uniref:Iron permease n=1 Tax=Merismopedia glauca CCAP 1448/3 TaxID=1296344 RepID=A0A2T1C3G3_9CYAN|nr:FTR1 family protein [Merismopedia glauca]PSB02815.1 iron permease [Merismopedia glauca CCAP 1448/3]